MTNNEVNATDIYLIDFFIYCPSLCVKEGQEGRKILYYYPSTVDIGSQIRRIGYCEGLVKFTETFLFDDPCETVHFQKTRLFFNQIEKDICIAMTLHIPVVEKKLGEQIHREYQEETVIDRLYLPLLKMAYRYFVFQQGLMSVILEHETVEKLTTILREYFDKFIKNYFLDMISTVTLNSAFFGLNFLTIEKRSYLKFQSILQRINMNFPEMKHTFITYRDQLMWTSLDKFDTVVLYSFFQKFYWPAIQYKPIASNFRYLFYDTTRNLFDELVLSNELLAQEYYLGTEAIPYRFLVINFHYFTLFFIFFFDEYLPSHERIQLTIEYLQKELKFMIPLLESEFQQTNSTNTTDQSIQNIYLNKQNMTHASTIQWHRDSQNHMINLMNSVAEDLQWFYPTGELLVKRENDPWIVAKRSDMREIIMTDNQKNSDMRQINDKVKQMLDVQIGRAHV